MLKLLHRAIVLSVCVWMVGVLFVSLVTYLDGKLLIFRMQLRSFFDLKYFFFTFN